MLKSVLIIDDDEILRTLVAQLLKTHLRGYEILSAASAKEGLEQAFQRKPDIILLDIMLQEDSGWVVAETLKADERTHHIPIVVASGMGSPYEASPFIESQLITRYIRKPYDVDELVTAIQEIAGKASESPQG